MAAGGLFAKGHPAILPFTGGVDEESEPKTKEAGQ
jgi:hypothetical protein